MFRDGTTSEHMIHDQPGIVVVVEDDADQGALLQRWIERAGHSVHRFIDGDRALAGLATTIPDALCLDLHLPGLSGLEVMERIRARHPALPIIVLTSDGTVTSAVQAMKAGAYDYLEKPVDRTKLETTLRNAIERARLALRLAQLETQVQRGGQGQIIGESAPVRALVAEIDRVAGTDVTVLVQGESGTGKELIARAIHDGSSRRAGPFVTVNCAAIPASLQESELFGHEKGAFTGATNRRIGRFESANGGTLFLDEVGELAADLQAKLLRVLQERTFSRVGSSDDVASDFRLIAATHRALRDDVEAGRFRDDLYYRLAVFEMTAPPLRARGEDVVLLADRFAGDYGRAHRGGSFRLAPETIDVLVAYDWPGNVRELQNAVQRAVVTARDGVIRPDDLPARVRGDSRPHEHHASHASHASHSSAAAPARDTARPKPHTLQDAERAAIEAAIRRAGGNLSEVSRELGIGRTTLYRKLLKFGLR